MGKSVRPRWFLCIFLCVGLPVSGVADNLKIGGTGAALGTMRQLLEVFEAEHLDDSVELLPRLGSRAGIKALLAGHIQLAVTARLLKEAEASRGLVEKLTAKTPVVLANSHTNPATGLAAGELYGTLTGARTEWPDGRATGLLARPAQNADFRVLADAYPSFSLILGKRRPLKVLSIDGIEPSVAGIEAGRYLPIKPFYLVTTQDPPDLTVRFMEFIHPKRGAEILQSNGNLPAGAK